MSRLPAQFYEDRELRDAARSVLEADLAHAKASFSGKGIAGRVTGRLADGAKDVAEVAKVNADNNRGIIAAVLAALILWFAREPILEIFGLSEPSNDDGESEFGETGSEGSDEISSDQTETEETNAQIQEDRVDTASPNASPSGERND